MDAAMEQVVTEAAKRVIRDDQPGCGIQTVTKEVIREQARHLIETDDELKRLLRERILFWIGEQ